MSELSREPSRHNTGDRSAKVGREIMVIYGVFVRCGLPDGDGDVA